MNQLPLWDDAPASERASIPSLSKSKVLAGLQCPKRLYLECYAPDTRDPIDASRQALFDAGREVGRVARGRFPGGVTMEEDPRLHDDAARATRATLADPRVPSIYEAAFTHDRIRVRVDVLARAGNGAWDVVEVKSATSVKEEYLPDLAVQLLVVEGSGLSVRRAAILHVNNQYVWEGGPYDLRALFTIQDLTEVARDRRRDLLGSIAAMREPLRALAAPDVPIGAQCSRPYVCPFWDTCHGNGPEHPIGNLPRLTPKLRRAFEDLGIDDIRDIPEDFHDLSELQRRVWDCTRRGVAYVGPELTAALRAIPHPVHFLDFETCNPALPFIPGTRPFQQTPFQWSDHVLERDGTVRHLEYLHEDRTDPRRPLARALIRALEGAEAIVVYSGFEARMIRAMAEALPDLSGPLLEHVERRIVDLHQLIHEHYYHPEFRGSFSIKDVLPVVVAGMGYGHLAIKDGSQAALAYVSMTDPSRPEEERRETREGLRAYCARDTEAMMRLFQTLKEVS
ncbi:MAG TPA: DUF2779 domain-containing protein [Candidatus Eisenbacteria bacterium]